MSKLESLLKNFSIRPGTVDYGKDYEFKITSLLSLRSVEHSNVEDMWLAANVDDCGAFDDIILFIDFKGKDITYLIQLKHQIDAKNIGVGEFKSKKDFNLQKYHNTISVLKSSQKESPITAHIKNKLDKTVFIIFTNRGTTESDCLLKIDNKSDVDAQWMFSQFINTNGNIAKFDYEKLGMTVEDNIKHLTKHNFFLFTKQLHINEVDAEIEKIIEKIIKPLKLPKNVLTDAVKKYISVIAQWSKGELGGHYLLTKRLINSILLEILLTPHMKKLEFSNNDNTLECDTWNLIVQNYPILVIEENDTVLKFLHNYIDKEINKYSNDVKNINLWKRHPDDVKKFIFRNTRRSKNIQPFEAYEYLWKNNHVPLFLQTSNVREFEDVLHILNKLKCKVGVIILLEKVPSLKNPSFTSGLGDLKHEHRVQVLEKKIKLQNRISVKLNDLLPQKLYHLLTIKDIVYILTNRFNIGNSYQELPEIFLTRTLQKIWIKPSVFKHVKDDIFMIKYTSRKNLEKFEKEYFLTLEDFNLSLWKDSKYLHKNNIFITDEEHKEEEFRCVNKTIHFLMLHDSNSLEWIKSIGGTKALVKYRETIDLDTTKKVSQILSNFYNNVNDKPSTILISDTPGMGKSVLLDYIALYVPINLWIVRINLYDYVNYYKSEDFKNACKSPSKYIRHFAHNLLEKQGCNDLLTESIFLDYLDSGKILLLFDGFDEVPVRFHESVKQMIRIIYKSDYCIYLTTRPVLKKDLEELLNTLAVSINPFSKNDQIEYLMEYFQKIVDVLTPEKEKLTELFVDKLLKATQRNLHKRDEEFTGIPLQIRLLAEVFSGSFKQFLQTQRFTNRNFDLLYLYREFMEQKVELVCQRYGNAFDDLQHNYKNSRSMYALRLLFSKEDLTSLNIEEKLRPITEFFPNDLQLIQKDGIVVVEDKDNVKFVHRTFAEYLAAEWLSENINTELRDEVKILLNKIFEQDYTVVRNIFDRILARNCHLHLAVINREMEFVTETILKSPSMLNETDKEGRTLLHLIGAWGIHHPQSPVERNYVEVSDEHIDTLFDLYADATEDNAMADTLKLIPISNFICKKDDIFNYTPLDYAILSGSLRIAEGICAKLENLYNWITVTSFDIHYINYYAYNCYYDFLKACAYKFYVSTKLNNFIPKDDASCNPLHIATIHSKIADAEDILQSGETNINAKDETGKTALHWATIKGCLEIIRNLFSKSNIDINDTDKYGMSAFHYAIVTCTNNQADVIKEFLKNKLDFSILDHNGKTAVHYVIECNQERCLKLLLMSDQKASILEVRDKEKITPLVLAAKLGITSLVNILLSAGADIEANDNFGDTSLHLAANNGHVDTVELLLSKGANAKAQNTFERTPLGLAALEGKKCVVELFMSKADITINAKEDNCFDVTLLHYAAWKGHNEVVSLLLANGADIEATDKHGSTALIYAIEYFHKHTVELLLSNGAATNVSDEQGKTALLRAVGKGDLDIVKLLLSNGASLEDKDKNENTPLIIAAYHGNLEVINLLLTKKLNVEAKDLKSMTALLWAAKKCRTKVVELLLEYGANIEARAEDGKTALIFAARKNHTSVVHVLLCAGANVEAYDNEHKTSLSWAAMRGHVETVNLLLSAGVDSKTKDLEGLTPLQWAERNGHTEVTFLLLNSSE